MAVGYYDLDGNLYMVVYPNLANTSKEITITNTNSDKLFTLFDLLVRKVPTQQIFNAGRNDTTINYLDASIRGIKWSLLRKHRNFRPRGSGN